MEKEKKERSNLEFLTVWKGQGFSSSSDKAQVPLSDPVALGKSCGLSEPVFCSL